MPNSNQTLPELQEIADHVGPAIVKALRNGNRGLGILKDLSDESKTILGFRGGQTRKTKSALEAFKPRFLEFFRTNDRAVRDSVVLWFQEKTGELLDLELNHWRDALRFRLATALEVGEIADPVRETIDAVISGDISEIPSESSTACLDWLFGTIASRLDAEIVDVLGSFSRSFEAIRTRIAEIGDVNDLSNWTSVATVADEFTASVRQAQMGLEVAFRSATRLATRLGLERPSVLRQADVSLIAQDELVALRELVAELKSVGSETVVKALDFLASSVSVKDLLAIPAQIAGELPPRDQEILHDESERIAALAGGAPTAAEVARAAPILSILDRMLVRGEEPTESELELLEERLSGKTCRQLRQGQLSTGFTPFARRVDNGDSHDFDRSEKTPVASADELEKKPSIKTIELADKDMKSRTEQEDVNSEIGGEPNATETAVSVVSIPVSDKSELPPLAFSHPTDPPHVDAADDLGPPSSLSAEERDDQESVAAGRLGRLLEEDRLDLAYWYAYSLGDHSPLPLWLVETVELGVQLRPAFSESEKRLQDLFAESLERIPELEPHQAFLLAAACVRPALLSPVASMLAVDQLADIAPAVPGLQGALRDFAEFAKKGRPLGGGLLRGLASSAKLEEERASLERRTLEWRQRAPARKTKFQAATAVWKHWVQPDGELCRLVDAASNASMDRRQIREQVEEWRERQAFTDRLDRTDRQLGGRTKANPIRHGALDALHRWSIEAIDLVSDWVEIHQAERAEKADERHHELAVLKSLKPSSTAALASLRQLVPGDQLEASCKLLLERSFEELVSGFEELARPAATRDPLIERRRLLLEFPRIGREFETPSPDRLHEELLRHMEAPLGAERAIEVHIENGQLDLAEQLRGMLSDDDVAERLDAVLSNAEREWRSKVESRILKVQEAIERQHLKGVLGESEKEQFVTEIGVISFRMAKELDRPDELIRGCASICGKLREIELQKVRDLDSAFTETRKLAEEQGIEVPVEVRGHFQDLLSRGSVAVANEVIAALRQGIDAGRIEVARIVDNQADRDYLRDFLAAIPAIYQIASDFVRLRAQLGKGELTEALGSLDSQQVKIIGVALQAWQQLILGRNLDPAELGPPLLGVLGWFGFQVEGLPARQGYGPNWKHLRVTATIHAPIPKYGSMADGRHDILLVWGELESEELGQLLATNSKLGRDRAVTVLHFNRLQRDARRRLMTSVRNQRHTAVLIDSCMLVWLAKFGAADRTLAMFEAGLPGSRGNPYAPEAAGAVPPEMFFGRESHVEDLWQPTGASIVYGGRQLGKSALLQTVRRKYHDPEHDRFVFYAGLRHQADVFDLIRELLRRHELLPKRGLKGADTVQSAVEDMLRDNPARRILVLLDECDQFLDEDRKNNFEQVGRVRDLMTNTERRFKVVFAGLHNVQRFQRVPNQPLAHFGEPLCVGPLGSPAARNLVRTPLRALGYRFEPESLVDRVLAYTNSHPSLVQLFCHALLEALEQRRFSNIEETPPYVIDEDFIAQIYRSTALGRKMRDRFDWTLDLDPRYRVLGYVVAFLEQEASFDESGAIPAYEAFSWASSFWPAAFGEANEDEVVGLLDEMKGLGVLVSRGPRGYRLRSPNVVRLLGGPQEVVNQLEAFREREYQAEIVPQVTRRAFENEVLPASPLTLDQLGALTAHGRSIDLIIGSKALSLHMVLPALRASLEGREEITIAEFEGDGLEGLIGRVRSIFQSSTNRNGVLLWLRTASLAPEVLSRFIVVLKARLLKLESSDRFVRILIPIEPTTLEHLYRNSTKSPLQSEGINIHHLRRWKEVGLRQWFYDVDRPGKMDLPGRWITETGGWPILLLPRLRSALLRDSEPEAEEPRQRLLDAAGLREGGEENRLFRTLVKIASADAEVQTLVDLVVEDGGPPPERIRAMIRYMLDLDILVGTPDKVRVEPVLAEVARVTPA